MANDDSDSSEAELDYLQFAADEHKVDTNTLENSASSLNFLQEPEDSSSCLMVGGSPSSHASDYFFAHPGGVKPKTTRPKTKGTYKSVRIDPEVHVRLGLCLDDYTQEEIDATWRTQAEERRSQAELVKTVKSLRANGYVDDDGRDLCVRGLEHLRSKEDTEKRSKMREFVKLAVMEEQETQRRMNFHDSRQLAEASDHISRLHVANAFKRAGEDAEYAGRRRLSLPEQYAAAVRRLSGALSSCDSTGAPEAGKRRRSSALSFEKHPQVVFVEINAIIDGADDLSQDDDDGSTDDDSDEEAAFGPLPTRYDTDRAVVLKASGAVETNEAIGEDELAIISKLEICILDKEVRNRNVTIENINYEDAASEHEVPSVPARAGRHRASFIRQAGHTDKNDGPIKTDTWGDFEQPSGTITGGTGGVSHLRRLFSGKK